MMAAAAAWWIVPLIFGSSSAWAPRQLSVRGAIPARKFFAPRTPLIVVRAGEPSDDAQDELRAAYVAGKGLEGSGPLVVVNKFLPAGFRYALYGLFGIVGGAGVGIAASQGKMDDVALNGVGLVLAVGFAFLDVSASKGQVEEAKAVMRNENLALGTYAEDDSQESKSGADGDDGASTSDSGSRIQTAADLFGSDDDTAK